MRRSATGRGGRAYVPHSRISFPIEPGPTLNTGNLTNPAIFFAGEDDTIVRPQYVRAEYDRATQVPAAYAELANATHFTALGNAGGFRSAATAWARWQLADDTTAAALFAGTTPDLADDPAWSAYESNARLRALDGGNDPGPEPEPECEWWQWWCD